MDAINIKRFGFAFGTAAVLFYLGCMFVMAMVGKEMSVHFFNSLLHGIDVSPIIRMNVPLTEALMGIVETFILGWFMGAIIASIYNFGQTEKK